MAAGSESNANAGSLTVKWSVSSSCRSASRHSSLGSSWPSSVEFQA